MHQHSFVAFTILVSPSTLVWLLFPYSHGGAYLTAVFVGSLCKKDEVGSKVEKKPNDPSEVVSNVLKSDPMRNFLYFPCSSLKCLLARLKPVCSTEAKVCVKSDDSVHVYLQG